VSAAANLGELLDAAALLASQPVPAGGRVAVVSTPAVARCWPSTHAAMRGYSRQAGQGDPEGAAAGAPPRGHGGRAGDTTVLATPGVFRQCQSPRR
jgi:hypothetical protein